MKCGFYLNILVKNVPHFRDLYEHAYLLKLKLCISMKWKNTCNLPSLVPDGKLGRIILLMNVLEVHWNIATNFTKILCRAFPIIVEVEKFNSVGSISMSHLLDKGGSTGLGSLWLPFSP
jgi:hypothetical protein